MFSIAQSYLPSDHPRECWPLTFATAVDRLLASVWPKQVHELRALHKEFVGRTRSLRFFERVRDLQSGGATTLDAHTADGECAVLRSEAGVLSCCGHVGTLDYLRAKAERQECPVAGCRWQTECSS